MAVESAVPRRLRTPRIEIRRHSGERVEKALWNPLFIGYSQGAAARRARYTAVLDEWHFIAERKIREGIEEGAFDRLDGAGEPVDLQENPFEDPSLRMAHRLLRNNGFAPGWIEESKEIEAETRLLRARSDVSTGEFRDRVAALNRRIAAFNLKAPALSLQKRPFEKER